MFTQVLLGFFRSLLRSRLYAALNITGLAIGIAVFLLLSLVVQYESGFNHWIPHASSTYRLDTTYSENGGAFHEEAASSFVALPLLQLEFPQIAAGARRMQVTQPVAVGNVIDSESISYVDPKFFDVIEVPFLQGNRTDALHSPTSVAVTAHIAQKYFGTAEAIGRTLDITRGGVRQSYIVSAILQDIPQDSSFDLDIVVPFSSAIRQQVPAFQKWGSFYGQTYLRIDHPGEAKILASHLEEFLQRHAIGNGPDQVGGGNRQETYTLSLVPLSDMNFHDVDVDAEKPGADRRVIYSIGLIGLLTLVTASINYVNLATAHAGQRAREVAVRKVLGASRQMLLLQFLTEALMTSVLAGVIGLALVALAVPEINALGGWDIRIAYPAFLAELLSLAAVVGIGAGLYPALVLVAYRPAEVLTASGNASGGRKGTRLRNLLVLAQFTCAVAFGICTLIVEQQANLLRQADRGFEKKGLIIVSSLQDDALLARQLVILDALRRVPGVAAVTLSDEEPDSDNTDQADVSRADLAGSRHVVSQTVGRDFFRTYKINLISGRLFDTAHQQDDGAGGSTSSRTVSTILNRTALGVLGFRNADDAIGKDIVVDHGGDRAALHVIGVVADVRFMSPRQPVSPQFYTFNSQSIPFAEAAIRFENVPQPEIMEGLRSAWHTVAPDVPFRAETADERLADFYRPDSQRAKLFTAGATLAIAVACVGLYGLASFTTARRTREIGIRKTLGASTRDVVLLLVGQFVQPVLLACLIACPIAWLAMRNWLSGFDQRVALSPVTFVAAILLALGLSVATVFSQSFRVARAKPAVALREQ